MLHGDPLTRAAIALLLYGGVGGALVRWGHVELGGAVDWFDRNPADGFLLGLLAVLGGGFAATVFVGAIAGYPAGVIGGGLYLLVLTLGAVVGCVGLAPAFGGGGLRRQWFVGGLILMVSMLVPSVGPVVFVALGISGTGSFVRWLFDGDPSGTTGQDLRRRPIPARIE